MEEPDLQGLLWLDRAYGPRFPATIPSWPRQLNQAHRRYKHQPVTTGLTNARYNQMAKSKCRNIAYRNLGNMAASEPNSPTTASPGYPNTPEKQDLDLKTLVMLLLEEHKKT